MVRTIQVNENKPYPNNTLPVLYYENALGEELGESYDRDEVIDFFENNGYVDGWAGVMKDSHHFHSTVHEAIAVTKGKLTVQLGGPNGPMETLRKGDVILLPAGVSHKKLDATQGFEIVGAYPENDAERDMQYGDASDYEAIKENIANVSKPLTDPVSGSPKNIDEYWS
jgi:uncharacterized protein YjlB